MDPSSEEKFEQLAIKLRPHIQKLWAAKWKLLAFNIVVMVLTIVYLKVYVKDYYISAVTILPEYGSKSSMMSQYSGLAAMAGINVGSTATPTDIYSDLITSETVLAPVIYGKYLTKEWKDSTNLVYYFKTKPDKKLPYDLRQRQMFIDTYNSLNKEIITTDVEKLTKILTITVKAPESKLSAEIANRIVNSLDNYVRTKRKSYAKDQLFYIQKRTKQVKDSLTVLEDKLEKFKDYNRITEESPELMLEQSRLLRAVEILNTVYVELNKQLEIAKIDEIKDTPVLNVKEPAKDPVIKAGPKRANTFVVIFLLSIIVSCAFTLFNGKLKNYYNLYKSI
jgi:uncharacterized protein involved in exopolysaccharide biosynthesis